MREYIVKVHAKCIEKSKHVKRNSYPIHSWLVHIKVLLKKEISQLLQFWTSSNRTRSKISSFTSRYKARALVLGSIYYLLISWSDFIDNLAEPSAYYCAGLCFEPSSWLIQQLVLYSVSTIWSNFSFERVFSPSEET